MRRFTTCFTFLGVIAAGGNLGYKDANRYYVRVP
jgi:hypothetical protein